MPWSGLQELALSINRTISRGFSSIRSAISYLKKSDFSGFSNRVHERLLHARMLPIFRRSPDYKNVYSTLLKVSSNQELEDYVPLTQIDLSGVTAPVKLIAFYLPQF